MFYKICVYCELVNSKLVHHNLQMQPLIWVKGSCSQECKIQMEGQKGEDTLKWKGRWLNNNKSTNAEIRLLVKPVFLVLSWVGLDWSLVLSFDVVMCWSSALFCLLFLKESSFLRLQASCSWLLWFLLVRTSVLTSCKLMINALPSTSVLLASSSSFWFAQVIEMSHRWFVLGEF